MNRRLFEDITIGDGNGRKDRVTIPPAGVVKPWKGTWTTCTGGMRRVWLLACVGR